MKRLSVVVLERDERLLLLELGHCGAVQLVRAQAGPDTAPLSPHDRSKELARCDRLQGRLEELCRSLQIGPALDAPVGPPGLTLDQAEPDLRALEEQSADLLDRRQRLLQRWGDLASVREQVASYRGLELPLGRADRFSFLHFVTGSVPAANLEKLQSALGDQVALLPLPPQEGRQPLVAMATRQSRPALEQALQQAGFQHEPLPDVEGSTADTLAETSQREQYQVSAELESVNAELQSLSRGVAPRVARMQELVQVERRLLEAEQHLPRTQAAVLLLGWVAADQAPRLEERLKQITQGRCAVETAEPGNLPVEQIPVLLRHPRLLRPFAMLVTAYGLPTYQELEPTLFVALSYVLMFGMMFGDVGHGAVLAAGGLIALLAGRTAARRDLGVLLLFAGLASGIFGFIYGSCFGLEGFKHYALWHDPLEGDPMRLMYDAIGIGIGMISLGLVLNVINRFRRGDVLGGLLDKFGVIGMLFYWGALALITQFAALQSRGLVTLTLTLCVGLPLAGWALKEPLEHWLRHRAGHPAEPGAGLFAAVTESLVGAFEAVLSYLANTISFVRLAAYAMSHAALLAAAFTMAGEVKHVAVGGTLWSVLVVVFGNLVALVLEGIIASVQALRLEYYEFFGKFFSGSGQPFTPFRLATHEPA